MRLEAERNGFSIMIMKRVSHILVFLLFAVLAIAQEELKSTEETKFAFSLSPQYVITGGMRMNFDHKVTEKGWLTLAPIIYYMDNSYMYDPESTSYIGVGVFANYRYFPSGKGIYAAGGVNYRFLNTDYSSYNETTEKNAKFNTYGFDFTFGYQFRLVEQLFMDLYLGWGFRYSQQNTEENEEYWSNAFLDLGYSGFLPVAGLRIGFEF